MIARSFLYNRASQDDPVEVEFIELDDSDSREVRVATDQTDDITFRLVNRDGVERVEIEFYDENGDKQRHIVGTKRPGNVRLV